MAANYIKGTFLVLIISSVFGIIDADFESNGGFFPSGYQRSVDQMAESSAKTEATFKADENDLSSDSQNHSERKERFGISSFGGTGVQDTFQSGFGGNTGTSVYGPLKIDLGGVLLGSIIGLGAVLVLPKIIQAFSSSYGGGGGYGRSSELDLSELTAMASRVDNALARYNIDSAACSQRIACSYVRAARDHLNAGNATDMDTVISSLSGNMLVQQILGNTPVMDAVATGRASDVDCQQKYSKCKLDKKTVIKMITQMLPA